MFTNYDFDRMVTREVRKILVRKLADFGVGRAACSDIAGAVRDELSRLLSERPIMPLLETILEEEKAPMEKVLTFKEVAEKHRVSTTTVLHWVNPGVLIGGMPVQLKAYRIGHSWRVTQEALEQFLRLCNSDTWRQIAEEQNRERKQAENDRKELRRKLDEMGTRPKPEEKYSRSYLQRKKRRRSVPE